MPQFTTDEQNRIRYRLYKIFETFLPPMEICPDLWSAYELAAWEMLRGGIGLESIAYHLSVIYLETTTSVSSMNE